MSKIVYTTVKQNTSTSSFKRQDDYTEDDIKELVKGLKILDNIKDMEILKVFQLNKKYIKYFNKSINKFRIGGMLIRVDYPDTISLRGINSKNVWKIKLENSIIFVDINESDNEKYLLYKEEKKKEKLKDKLYDLYINNKLQIKK